VIDLLVEAKAVEANENKAFVILSLLPLKFQTRVQLTLWRYRMSQANSEMPMRTLGRTGVEVSLIGLGGWHLGFDYLDEQLSIRIIRTAIDSGINFMDNCWDYNEGASETRMGKALRDGYRDRVFLMTKIDGRTKAGRRETVG
jgi:hypothetical protein